MLLGNLQCLFSVYFLLSLILWVFAGYAYFVNSRRQKNDPLKQNIHPVAILLAPVTWPFFLILAISLTLIKLLLRGFLGFYLFGLQILLRSTEYFLSLVIKILQKVLNLLKGHFFLRFGLALLFLGSICQFLALLN